MDGSQLSEDKVTALSHMQRQIKGELINEHLSGLNKVNLVLNSTCKNTTLHRLRQNCAHFR